MLGRHKAQRDLLESFGVQKVSPGHILLRLDRMVDWSVIEARLASLYPSPEGRPSYPPLMLFKALLLAQWYRLSDPALEEQVRDRLSFQRFLGLSVMEEVPDETTYCRFRGKLNEAGLFEELFLKVNRQLETQGLLLKEGSIVDASLIESRNKKSDGEGKWTRRGRRLLFGYKLHASCDPDHQLIQDLEVTSAEVADARILPQVIPDETKTVWADKAYDSKKQRQELKKRGITDRILWRRWKGRKLTPQQETNNWLRSRVRVRIERVFAHLKTLYDFHHVRYRGMIRNRGHGFLLATAYNLKRALKIVETRQQLAAAC